MTIQSTSVVIKLQKQPPEVFCKKRVLNNFAKFTGQHLCQRLFFNKVAGVRLATLLKKGLWHRCFPLIFAKLLRTPFLQCTSWQLLLTLGIIVKKQNICNLIGWNRVHIFDIFNCNRANVKGMWNARKLGGIHKTFWIYTNLKRTFGGIG